MAKEIGIVGTIESKDSAKRVIWIACISIIFFAFINILHGNIFDLLTIPLAIVMAFFRSRVVALVVFLLTLFSAAWAILMTLPMLLGGRFLRLYLPIFALIVLWLSYRSIRATLFIHEQGVEQDLSEIRNVFE